MSKLDEAIALACKVHAGQKDKAGQAYILHPLRLMLRFQSDEERIVSVLHDVLEDGDINSSNLRQQGWSETIISAIECLSRKSNETYEEFIQRVSRNSLAKKVKIADIEDNLNISRLSSLNDKDIDRIKKYHKALLFLKSNMDDVNTKL